MTPRPPRSTLFPYTTLFRSTVSCAKHVVEITNRLTTKSVSLIRTPHNLQVRDNKIRRSEEHTSELQSRLHLVCRLLLEKKIMKSKTLSFHGCDQRRTFDKIQ